MTLNDSVSKVKYISSKYEKLLNKLGIFTIKDLITYFPRSYIDSSEIITIKELYNKLDYEAEYTIQAYVKSFKNVFIRGKKSLQNVVLEDNTGQIQATFFNQPFLKNVFKQDKEFLLLGKIKPKGKNINFSVKNYDEVKENKDSIHLGRIVPEYRLTTGLSKKWLRNRLINVLEDKEIQENIDNLDNITKNTSAKIFTSHYPESFEELKSALRDLSILELANIHLKIRKNSKKIKSDIKIDVSNVNNLLKEFLAELPFEPTQDQQAAISEIVNDLSEEKVLNRLIQGDVGTGKTLIAMFASLLFVKNGYQVAILAPTTVLAKQHYKNFKQTLKKFNLDIDLITSATNSKEPSQIMIGTSAILARKNTIISNLGLIIVDEQHRFGVNQREELLKPLGLEKKKIPHFIDMTATPIPRTIAETFFSDLNVSTIKTKPKGRKPIKTFFVPENKRTDGYEWIRKQLETGSQAYWICPLVEESEKMQAKAAEETYKELKKVFSEYNVDLLHGRMKNEEKTDIMKNYSDKNSDILVSTSVIEVGIDVPNASIMVIENAERFGLAQLHQIRGRVGRGERQSYCFMFSGEEITEQSRDRLEFLCSSNDGLEIAEYDLQLRGPGEVYGTRQSGIPDLKIAKINDLELIRESKKLAESLWDKGVKEVKLFE